MKGYQYPSLFNFFRNSKFSKVLAFVIICELLGGNIISTPAKALTTGPSQPEASNFQPASITNLVDPFSGDFSYNIPVMEIGGYPLNLAYSAGVTQDQEATWVGLGWNLNTGAIVRNMRGLPDDFSGDVVKKQFNVKDNITGGVNVGLGGELLGFEIGKVVSAGFSFGVDVAYNNYTGFSISKSFNPTIGASGPAKGSLNVGLGITSSSSNGLTISPSLSLSQKINNNSNADVTTGLNIGLSMNSRTGLGNLSLSGSYSGKINNQVNNVGKDNEEVIRGQNLGSSSIGANINFATPSYVPQVERPFKNYAFTFNSMIGIGAIGGDVDLKIGGYYMSQTLDEKSTKHPAFGYLYSERGQNNEKCLQDFNREKDGSYIPQTTPKLAVTNYTHDIFQIQAQGLSGSIRPYRDDASYVHNSTVISPNTSGNLAFEISTTQVIDGGGSGGATFVKTQSGIWKDHNNAKNNLPFKHRAANNPTEKVHMKLAGEHTVESDLSFYNNIGQEKPVRFALEGLRADRKLVTNDNEEIPLNGSISRVNRQNRVNSVEYLTVAEMTAMYPHRVKNLPHNGNGQVNKSIVKQHHIAQITVVKPDGTRYVFALPAYNTKQVEVSFNIGKKNIGDAGPQVQLGPNTVTYASGDNSIGNSNGIDHRYDKTELPAYVHTWYLTEILSPDYVDVTGDGPSDDDLGTYTFFEYGTPSANNAYYKPDIANYKWRTPVSDTEFRAGYNKNLHTDPYDDVANILYGEKQVWYVHKISSKTQVCVFDLIDREDGYGVVDINGDIAGTNALKAINTITLYAKEDWLLQQADPMTYTAVPVKTVHFKYSYELCDGVPNNINGNGKLTLKAVYFTFDKSGRAKYSPYTFEYIDTDPSVGTFYSNPPYCATCYDRWGNYKPAPTVATDPDNADYPYVVQNKANQDKYANAWNLQKITLPSGGIISIDYESDDYAYVQDRQACQMFKVVGSKYSTTSIATLVERALPNFNNPEYSKLYAPNAFDNQSENLHLYIELEEPITTIGGTPVDAPTADGIIKKKYFAGETAQPNGPLKYLYFRFYVNVGTNPGQKEYVSGYAEAHPTEIRAIGSTGNWTHAAIKLVNVVLENEGSSTTENPISKAAWQFSRINTPRLAYNQSDPTDLSPQALLNTLSNASLLKTLLEMIQGQNRRMRNSGFGSQFDQNKSWVRLLDPDGIKLGGGHRVKKITIDDNWNTLSDGNESSFTYGQEYNYKLDDGRSSGVASWEPVMGADENPFRTPIFINKNAILAPDEKFYVEEPLGESFVPSPGVGYSKVEIKNIARTNVSVNATGKTIQEFYTAKDFPTKFYSTQPFGYRQKSPISFSFLITRSFDKIAISQGYTIINNDMHGKPMREAVFDESGTLISEKKYEYKRNGDELNNMVDVVNPDGSVEQKMIGVDFDFIADMRQMETKTRSGSAQINAAFFLAGVFPLVIPTIFPEFTSENTMFRSATTTKVFFKSGILEKTIVTDKGARVTTENIAYDSQTGDVLVTKVNNEYNKERYAVNLPAHWAYDRMGFAAANWGYSFNVTETDIEDISGVHFFDTGAPFLNMLVPGDEVMPLDDRLRYPTVSMGASANTHRLWVAENENGRKCLIDYNGDAYSFNFTPPLQKYNFKVIRSGRRNMPVSSIGSLEVSSNPIKTISTGPLVREFDVEDLKVLNASANEYSENWRTKILRNNTLEYTTVNCGPNAMGSRLISFLNQLAANDELVTAYYSDMIDPADVVHLPNPHYNTTGLLPPGSESCDYFYAARADGYSNDYYTDLGLDNNAWLHIAFNSSSCEVCDIMRLISLSDATEFEVEDFANIDHFTSMVNITNANQLPVNSPYLYLYYNPGQTFIITAVMDDGTSVDFILFNGCSDLFDIGSSCCTITETYDCNLEPDLIVNPYLYGLLGNWRAMRGYTYLTNRLPANAATFVDRSVAGYFDIEKYFWKIQGTAPYWVVDGTDENWRWTAEITNYNITGGEVENVNPLSIYSSAVYGYKQTLPIMVSQNAKYKETGFDGFEDYLPLAGSQANCVKEHFKVDVDFWDYVTSADAHTGKKSLYIDNALTPPKYTYTSSAAQIRRPAPEVPFRLNANDILPNFSPDDDAVNTKKFILSFWIKNDAYTTVTQSYASDFSAEVKVDGVLMNTPTTPKLSPIIDGWQLFEYEFDFPIGTSDDDITFEFIPVSGSYYLDDVRVHPFDATAKSFVYDHRNLRFMAELDENNYSTYYEYDNEGALVRVKKETERGVMTLKENRNYTFKRNP